MSSLFTCSVLAIEGRVARFRMEVVHPDQWDIPSTKNFALQILVDAFWTVREGFLFRDQPVDEAVIAAAFAGASRAAELEGWLEAAHGRSQPISPEAYAALRNGVGTAGLSGWGSADGAHYKQFPPDYDGFCRTAEAVVQHVELQNSMGNPKSQESDPHPTADVVVEVRDAALLDFLVAGMSWDSAIYDFSGYLRR